MYLFWYACFKFNKELQKEMVKEAAVETAALGMCWDTTLRLCLIPVPRHTQASWGHRPAVSNVLQQPVLTVLSLA